MIRSAKAQSRLHLVLAGVWAMALIPTLIWWKSSILWVAGMSLYANFIGHWSAYQAARAEHANGSTNDGA